MRKEKKTNGNVKLHTVQRHEKLQCRLYILVK